MDLLKDKVVLITGAARGIGRATALMCARNGAAVAYAVRVDNDNSRTLGQELSSTAAHAKGYVCDVADFANAQTLVDNVLSDFGRIDVLINNAGIVDDTLLLRMSEQQWDRVINTNLKSVFALSKAAVRPMLRQRGGAIVNIASVSGLRGNAGQCNYAASKAGIIGFTKSLAKEVGSRNIRCNVVAPGLIATAMTGSVAADAAAVADRIALQRLGTPDDVAAAIIFLASDMAAYVTGQVLQVCGGIML